MTPTTPIAPALYELFRRELDDCAGALLSIDNRQAVAKTLAELAAQHLARLGLVAKEAGPSADFMLLTRLHDKQLEIFDDEHNDKTLGEWRKELGQLMCDVVAHVRGTFLQLSRSP